MPLWGVGWDGGRGKVRHAHLALLVEARARGDGLRLLVEAGAGTSTVAAATGGSDEGGALSLSSLSRHAGGEGRGQWGGWVSRWVPGWGTTADPSANGTPAADAAAAAQRRYFITVHYTAAAVIATATVATEPTAHEAAIAGVLAAVSAATVSCEATYYTSGRFATVAPWMPQLLLDCGRHGMEWIERNNAIHAGLDVFHERLQSYYLKSLEPYKYPEDTKTSMSLRVADSALTAANMMSPFLQSWRTAITFLRHASKLTTFTPYMIGYIALSNDVGEALADLAALMYCEQLSDCQITTKDLAVGLYYLLIYRRGERGNNPMITMSEHVASAPGVVDPEAPPDALDVLSKYAPLAKFVYQEPQAEVQRLCRLQGYTLLHYEPLVPIRHPPYALLVHEGRREAEVVIRGTKHISDVLVDMCATPGTLRANGTEYQVHRGMLRSALWVLCKTYLVLRSLKRKRYRIGIVGHSLGAGIGMILTAILRDSFLPDLMCVGFATPSCGDRAFAAYCEGFALSCVNGDDIVPRVRPGSIRNLLVAVSDPVLQDHSQRDLSGDTAGLLSRLYTAWAPKLRDAPRPAEAPSGTPPGGAAETPLSYMQCLIDSAAASPDADHLFSALQNESFATQMDGTVGAAVGGAHTHLVPYVAMLEAVMAADTVNVLLLSRDGLKASFQFKRRSRLSLLRCFAAEQCGLASPRCARLYLHTPPATPVLLNTHAVWDKSINKYLDASLTGPMAPLIVYVFPQSADADGEPQSPEFPPLRPLAADGLVADPEGQAPAATNTGVLSLTFCNHAEQPEFLGLLEVDFDTCSVKAVAAAIACAARRTDFRAVEVFRASPQVQADIVRPADTHVAVGDGESWKMKLSAAGMRSGDTLMGRDAWGARLAGRATAPRPDTEYGEFWPPGRVVHLYRCCGHTKAAVLRPWARALERIELSSKCADDHRMDSIMRALRAVRATRAARVTEIKPWEPFFAAERCGSCRSEFSWCATGESAAAALRSQCHCHHCGRVVCSECRQKTLPTVLSLHPVPVCDTCFFTLPTS